MFSGLRKVKQSVEGAFKGNKASFANVSELASLDQKTRVAILQEIRNGTPVDAARARLHKLVHQYLDQQLSLDAEIMPGVYSTGFSHVRRVGSPSAVIENGWGPQDLTSIKQEILDASIAYASNPTGMPPHDAFTFDQIAKRQGPTQVDSMLPSGMIHGVDGFGNQTMTIPWGDREFEKVIASNLDAHVLTPFSALGNDHLACQRAAWLSALTQIEPETLEKELLEQTDGKHAEVIRRIAKLAEYIQTQSPSEEEFMEAVKGDGVDGQTTYHLKYPEGLDLKKNSLEEELNALTHLLLKDVRSADGEPLMDRTGAEPGVFTITLLNKLGVDCAVMDLMESSGDLEGIKLSITAAGCDSIHDLANNDEPGSQADIAIKHTVTVPMVMISPGGIFFKIPREMQQPAEEGEGQPNTSQPAGNPAATGADPAEQANEGTATSNGADGARESAPAQTAAGDPATGSAHDDTANAGRDAHLGTASDSRATSNSGPTVDPETTSESRSASASAAAFDFGDVPHPRNTSENRFETESPTVPDATPNHAGNTDSNTPPTAPDTQRTESNPSDEEDIAATETNEQPTAPP